MRVYTLIAQRKCSYPGEHAPEIIDACDEWAWGEDPMGYLREKMEEADKLSEFTAMRIFITEIDDAYIDEHLVETVAVPAEAYDYAATNDTPSR